jgi:hypothetical protein
MRAGPPSAGARPEPLREEVGTHPGIRRSNARRHPRVSISNAPGGSGSVANRGQPSQNLYANIAILASGE